MSKKTWTGAANNGNWDDPNNWDQGVPQAGDIVVITQAGAQIIYQNPTEITGLLSVSVDAATLTQNSTD
jgi:hypothetical protein